MIKPELLDVNHPPRLLAATECLVDAVGSGDRTALAIALDAADLACDAAIDGAALAGDQDHLTDEEWENLSACYRQAQEMFTRV